MEPGLRDREYVMLAWMIEEGAEAAMEPGLRDREYTHTPTGERLPGVRCNGARS